MISFFDILKPEYISLFLLRFECRRVTQKVKIQNRWEGKGNHHCEGALSCLAYSHCHLFLHLKKHLTGQKFHADEEVKNKITMWLHAQAAEFCDGIQKLVPRRSALTGVGVMLKNSQRYFLDVLLTCWYFLPKRVFLTGGKEVLW